ncbi:sensor histidine kinase [Haloferax volcanii]|uniref:sensor histidine kinase n=1 Tax=Haloferax volcanii TaxID=2246 RepID=UPI0023DCDCF4|nr:HAMP domain-containing sensor histidine kinase [Haloferax lucentense]WEL27308.1 Signal transduction histidine kinase, contains REC and PAS domains [Haloferax lucentense]
MTDETRLAITFDDFPEPVIAYAVEGGEPRITALNEAFESVFDCISSGMPVAAIFEHFSVVNPTDDEDPITHLRRGDSVNIYLDGVGEGGPFLARAISSGPDAGYIVFTDLSACLDVAEAPAVDQVSSVISHDLRNPLDVAKAHLRAAKETGDDEHFDTVANAHDRMEQIIRDVLTITRDRTAVDPSDDVSIETAAEDAWESVDTEQATLEVTDTLPTVTADADRLRRLFENLFRNSVEHGSDVDDQPVEQEEVAHSKDGVSITVGAMEDGFYVADDGPGIPPEDQHRVFEAGYSTRGEGTGLGLAIVKRIVAAHDWELTLTTASNGGARFEIRF